MERIHVLGTGAGIVYDCYNTCFLLENDEKYMLVDTGAGSQVLNRIKDSNVDILEIHDIFISHKHIDHLLGIFVVLRVICGKMAAGKYEGNLNIYCAKEVREIIEGFVEKTSHGVHIQKFYTNVIFHDLEDGQEKEIIGYKVKILDLHSIECAQFGFQVRLHNGKILNFLGDVPCSEKIYDKIRDTDWVLHEVFCRETEKEMFKPHEKNHSTIKDVCEKMQMLQVRNLVLWHTMDNNITERKQLYTEEAKKYYIGNIYVPNDLEIIELS